MKSHHLLDGAIGFLHIRFQDFIRTDIDHTEVRITEGSIGNRWRELIRRDKMLTRQAAGMHLRRGDCRQIVLLGYQ